MNDEEIIIYNFFKLFSSMEYNLKKNGYLNKDEDWKIVKPNWKAFWEKNEIKIIEQIINSDEEELQKSVSFLFNEPPRVQYYKNRELKWEDWKKGEKTSEWLIEYIKRIRNNLFHWWKSAENYMSIINYENKRDMKLIESATIILNKLCRIDVKINSYYN